MSKFCISRILSKFCRILHSERIALRFHLLIAIAATTNRPYHSYIQGISLLFSACLHQVVHPTQESLFFALKFDGRCFSLVPLSLSQTRMLYI